MRMHGRFKWRAEATRHNYSPTRQEFMVGCQKFRRRLKLDRNSRPGWRNVSDSNWGQKTHSHSGWEFMAGLSELNWGHGAHRNSRAGIEAGCQRFKSRQESHSFSPTRQRIMVGYQRFRRRQQLDRDSHPGWEFKTRFQRFELRPDEQSNLQPRWDFVAGC